MDFYTFLKCSRYFYWHISYNLTERYQVKDLNLKNEYLTNISVLYTMYVEPTPCLTLAARLTLLPFVTAPLPAGQVGFALPGTFLIFSWVAAAGTLQVHRMCWHIVGQAQQTPEHDRKASWNSANWGWRALRRERKGRRLFHHIWRSNGF